MWSLRDEERKRKKKGGVKWELMELYKTVTNMGDLWDHSLPGYARVHGLEPVKHEIARMARMR